jgi:hypothetical protein
MRSTAGPTPLLTFAVDAVDGDLNLQGSQLALGHGAGPTAIEPSAASCTSPTSTTTRSRAAARSVDRRADAALDARDGRRPGRDRDRSRGEYAYVADGLANQIETFRINPDQTARSRTGSPR